MLAMMRSTAGIQVVVVARMLLTVGFLVTARSRREFKGDIGI